MAKPIYKWKRFWCPRTGSVNLSDSGYLYDPESEWGHLYNPDVKPLESLAEIPCLALLGEPGIGKTYAIQTEKAAVDAKVRKEGDETFWLDLRSYGSEDRLVRNLFESQPFVSWVQGEHNLHVFLDSLDECLIRIDTLAALLTDELKKYPVERLSLRLTCRTADWPDSLEVGLQELWGEEAMEVYELVPLRRVDVLESAKDYDLNTDEFLGEIERLEAVPLAIKPVTLNFLLSTFRRHGSFPSSQTELYLEGCRLLCEESNVDRRDARLTGSLSAEQRMIVAARIAAVTVFANRYAVWTDVDQGEVLPEDVTIQQLYGGKEKVADDEFEVSEGTIKEALGVGLFSARGQNRIGWAHQTYAEFLAAHYLKQHQMSLVQVMNLIILPNDHERRIVPQLHAISGWLASMDTAIFREIVNIDPEVLLRSDVATADEKDRSALAETLLCLYDQEKLLDKDLDIWKYYRKLSHQGLAEQIRQYLNDDTKSLVARRVAIQIADACELQTLQDDLAIIALDISQPVPVRKYAAYAIFHIGSKEAKAKLKPLAIGKAGDDPDDELKGWGLQAVWPDHHITAEEFFAVITLPKRENYSGAYQAFLLDGLVRHLKSTDLPEAMEWVANQPRLEKPHSFEKLVNAIMLRAWEDLESSSVLEAFAKAALSRLSHLDAILVDDTDRPATNVLRSNDERRRRVLSTILPMLSDPEKDLNILAYSGASIVFSKDVPWMIEQLQNAASEELQYLWAQLIWKIYSWNDPDLSDVVLTACQHNPILADVFSRLLNPVDLSSPEAEKMKKDYEQMQRWQREPDPPPLIEPPPAERVALLLNEYESGNLDAWWRLNREMILKPNSTPYGDEFDPDLTALPGWEAADIRTRARIVEAAKSYALKQDPKTETWFGTNTFDRPACAGYRALLLLMREEPSFFSAIPADVWRKWAPTIISYPLSNLERHVKPHRALVRWAYQNAPSEIVERLMVLIDKENEQRDQIVITSSTADCWDGYLADALLTKAKDRQLKPSCMGSLLGVLLDKQVKEARVFAESLLSLPLASDEEERSRAIVAACALINKSDDAGWSVVWPAIQQDVEFGREVFSTVAHDYRPYVTNVGQRLTEDQLADLYIWLSRQYPQSEDPEHDDACWVGPRDSVADWRNSLLRHLQQRGTNQACEAIQRISKALPELQWLKWTLLEARSIARHHMWVPLRPSDILAIAKDQQVRLVQNGLQLLEVLIESLKRLEEKLQGETPASIFLWDQIQPNAYRPKNENSFSDYVKLHFDDDLKKRGVIVNREVEIRKGAGSGQGERTDIHVDAVVRNSQGDDYDSVTTIVEVKGCWHKELNSSMETQLKNRYLRDNQCQQGLYLVGWFNCKQWDENDYRKRATPNISVTEAQERFDLQATALSEQEILIKAFVVNTALR